MAFKFTNALRTAMANAIVTEAGSGSRLRIYSGTRPTDANTAIAAQTLLGELTISGTLGTVSNGVITLGTVTQDSAADATGTASFFRLFKSDGTSVVMDGDVAVSASDLNINTTAIQANATISISSGTITIGNA